MRAAIYTRISLDRDQTKAGVERQRKDCLALVERNGWDLVGVFTDNSISAYSGKPRPAWNDLIDRIKNREVDVVVAWASDRLTRHPRELEDLVDLLEDTGCTVRTVTSGEYDLSTPEGRMTARIHGAVARQESERKSVRVAAAKEGLRAEGKWTGGQRPYGWTKNREKLIPEEAEVIRGWCQRVIDGDSLNAIWRDMVDSDIPSVNPKGSWKRTTIRGILTNPAIAGLVHYKGEIVGEAVWPAIVDRDTWEKVNAILDDPKRKLTYRNTHLLTGLIHDHHGRKMKSQPDQGTRQYMSYRDDTYGSGCTIVAEAAERAVTEAVFSYLDDQPIPEIEDPLVDSTSRIETLEAEMAELVGYRERDEIRLSEFVALSKDIKAKIDEERARLPETASLDLRWTQPGALQEAWSELSITQRKAALREIVERVVVRPRRRGDKPRDRVSIEFRS